MNFLYPFHWPSNPWVRGSYACLRPGDWTGLRGAMGESVGGLHFAGEHCALDTQGFMEGGVESGEAAAAEVLARTRPVTRQTAPRLSYGSSAGSRAPA